MKRKLKVSGLCQRCKEMPVIWLFCSVIFLCSKILNADIIAIDRYNHSEKFIDSELRFTHSMEGFITEANPVDACSNITKPPYHLHDTRKWFVLIVSSGCSIDMKAYHAQIAKYSAAVIYDDPGPVFLQNRLRHNAFTFLNITVVGIAQSSGMKIKENYLYTIDPKSRILIIANNAFHIRNFFIVILSIAALVVIVILLYTVVTIFMRKRLSSHHLRQLHVTKFKKGDPYDTCSICLDDYNENEKLRILPCSHGFHCKCIDPWLLNNRRVCPMCKQKVALPGMHSDDDSNSDTESRAETTPLLQGTARRTFHHGIFNSHFNIPGYEHSTRIVSVGSGETTSRDAPSDNLDET